MDPHSFNLLLWCREHPGSTTSPRMATSPRFRWRLASRRRAASRSSSLRSASLQPAATCPPARQLRRVPGHWPVGSMSRLIPALVRLLSLVATQPLRIRPRHHAQRPLADIEAEGPEVPPHGTVKFQTIRGVARSTANPRGRAKRGHGVSGRRGCPFASYLACPNFAEARWTRATGSRWLPGSMGCYRLGRQSMITLRCYALSSSHLGSSRRVSLRIPGLRGLERIRRMASSCRGAQAIMWWQPAKGSRGSRESSAVPPAVCHAGR